MLDSHRKIAAVLLLGSASWAIGGSSTVTFHLMGTADYPDGELPTREITVGPDVFGGTLLETDTVIDLPAVTGRSNDIQLSSDGGIVDVFVGIETDAPSGVYGFYSNVSCSPPDVDFSIMFFDVPFLDSPGRMGNVAGIPSPLPQERRMAGARTFGELGQFYQSMTSDISASTGFVCVPDSLCGFGASIGPPFLSVAQIHTWGIGALGQGQGSGMTIVGRFRVAVPPLGPGGETVVYTLTHNPDLGLVILSDIGVEPLTVDDVGTNSGIGLTITVSQTGSACERSEDCNDSDACTEDICLPTMVCSNEPIDVDDGDPCTVDTCDSAVGAVHEPVDVEDGDACTVDACDPLTGEITHTRVECSGAFHVNIGRAQSPNLGVSPNGSLVTGGGATNRSWIWDFASASGFEIPHYDSVDPKLGMFLPGWNRVITRDISNSGTVVGTGYNGTEPGPSYDEIVQVAIEWNEEDGYAYGAVYPCPFTPPDYWSDAVGISADGLARCGGSGGSVEDSSSGHCYRAWRLPLFDDDVLPVPGARTNSRSTAISSDGSTVVGWLEIGFGMPGAHRDAVRWRADGFDQLGGLEGVEVESLALGVSGDGAWVVGQVEGPRGTEAFRWSESTGYELLTSPDFATPARAHDVSGNGSVIVGQAYHIPSERQAAFIWLESGEMFLLQDVATSFGFSLGETQLDEAIAVSDDGLVIAGIDYDDGSDARGDAWVLRLGQLADDGDCDGDGDVDLTDLGTFQLCYTGSDAGPVAGGCACSDFDDDGDVDLTDFAAFQLAFTGSM